MLTNSQGDVGNGREKLGVGQSIIIKIRKDISVVFCKCLDSLIFRDENGDCFEVQQEEHEPRPRHCQPSRPE